MSFCVFSLCSAALLGQEKPLWLDADARSAQFPNSVYLTGFASGNDLEKVKLSAQTDLLENLRVIIESKTTSEMTSIAENDNYDEISLFRSSAEKSTTAEIVGMNIENYIDKKTNNIFAFAYVNKYELIGYYKANLTLQIQQAASTLNTAEQLEKSGEKAKARQQCEQAMPLLAKIRSIQDLLTALDNTANTTALKVIETEQMRNTLTQMQARLAQGVYVYVESIEDLFGQKVDIVANKVKAELAKNGCSFTEDAEEADFKLKISVSTRHSSNDGGNVFCFADTMVELHDNHKQKVVYGDEFAQKGGSTTHDRAGRKAMDDVVPKIAEKLKSWIQ